MIGALRRINSAQRYIQHHHQNNTDHQARGGGGLIPAAVGFGNDLVADDIQHRTGGKASIASRTSLRIVLANKTGIAPARHQPRNQACQPPDEDDVSGTWYPSGNIIHRRHPFVSVAVAY